MWSDVNSTREGSYQVPEVRDEHECHAGRHVRRPDAQVAHGGGKQLRCEDGHHHVTGRHAELSHHRKHNRQPLQVCQHTHTHSLNKLYTQFLE